MSPRILRRVIALVAVAMVGLAMAVGLVAGLTAGLVNATASPARAEASNGSLLLILDSSGPWARWTGRR